MDNMPELRVFEVDQQTTFDVKEPLLSDEKLLVHSRYPIATEFTERGRWATDLLAAGFDSTQPSIWLLEGLLMYLSMPDTHDLMKQIGKLSTSGSTVFHDACSANYVRGGRGPVVGGAPFIGGSDNYAQLWAQEGGFARCYVHNFESFSVDRRNRRVMIDDRVPEATPKQVAGRNVVLFVVAQKE